MFAEGEKKNVTFFRGRTSTDAAVVNITIRQTNKHELRCIMI